jgi:hypothetical protein
MGPGSHRLTVEIGGFRRLVSSVSVLPDTYLTAAVILVRLEGDGPDSGLRLRWFRRVLGGGPDGRSQTLAAIVC